MLVVSHLCHPQPSANDNGSGVAATLEAARTLATLRDAGHLGALALHRAVPVDAGVHGHVRLARGPAGPRGGDRVGAQPRHGGREPGGLRQLLPHGASAVFPAIVRGGADARIREQAVDRVPSYAGAGHYSLMRMAEVPYAGGSDHSVLIDPAVGVPCPMLIQWPDRFYHSSHDTPDKCDPALPRARRPLRGDVRRVPRRDGRAEREWLLGAVARGARRRLLAGRRRTRARARDAPRARARGRAALAQPRAARARRGRDRCRAGGARRLRGAEAGRSLRTPKSGPRRARDPGRRVAAPLDYQRHLLQGYGGSPRRAGALAHGGGGHARRPQAVRARLVRVRRPAHARGDRGLVELETGRQEPEFIEEFFARTAALGLREGPSRGGSMEFQRTRYGYALKLEPGEEIFASLQPSQRPRDPRRLPLRARRGWRDGAGLLRARDRNVRPPHVPGRPRDRLAHRKLQRARRPALPALPHRDRRARISPPTPGICSAAS